MGWLQDILGVAAPIVGGVFGGPVGAAIGGGVSGLLGGKSAGTPSGTQTTTNTQTMDPRVSSMLFGGSNGNGPQTGLLSQYQGMLGQPQAAGANIFGKANDNYIGEVGAYDLGQSRNAAYGLMAGNTAAPTMQAGQAGAAQAQAAQVNAPAQNNMNLTGSYDKFINGDAGANPYLNKAIGGAVDQSTNQFRQMQGESTDNLMRNIMPSIRSNSVLSGQYGGSRQGIAEGNAISDFTKQQNQSMTQMGQNNTNAAVGAQAQSFNQGQDRALAATQGLGAQQYGVASQNAGMQQQTNLANADHAQQANLTNAGLTQGANQANLGAQMNTNSLNSANTQAGISGVTGILGAAAGQAQNQDSYALNQAGKVNGLLAPYLGQVPGSSTSSQPLYQNQMGNILGGATAGLGLAQKFGGLLGGSGPGTGSSGGGPAGTYFDGYGYVPIGQ